MAITEETLTQLATQLFDSSTDEDDRTPSEQEEASVLDLISHPMLALPVLQFIEQASRFNVVKNHYFQLVKNNIEKRKEHSVSGNTRDEPTPFIYHCKKTPGCPYTSDKDQIMKLHEKGYCSEKKLAAKSKTAEE